MSIRSLINVVTGFIQFPVARAGRRKSIPLVETWSWARYAAPLGMDAVRDTVPCFHSGHSYQENECTPLVADLMQLGYIPSKSEIVVKCVLKNLYPYL